MAQAFKDLRKRAYLNPDGADKPLGSPVARSTLVKARGYQRQRLVDELHKRDCAAILLYDPVDIRYAFDVSNMQLWMTHNASHCAMLCADGATSCLCGGRGEQVMAEAKLAPNLQIGWWNTPTAIFRAAAPTGTCKR